MYDSIHWDILGMCEELRRLIRAQVIMTLQTELSLDLETQMMNNVFKESEKATAVSEEQQVEEGDQNDTYQRHEKKIQGLEKEIKGREMRTGIAGKKI